MKGEGKAKPPEKHQGHTATQAYEGFWKILALQLNRKKLHNPFIAQSPVHVLDGVGQFGLRSSEFIRLQVSQKVHFRERHILSFVATKGADLPNSFEFRPAGLAGAPRGRPTDEATTKLPQIPCITKWQLSGKSDPLLWKEYQAAVLLLIERPSAMVIERRGETIDTYEQMYGILVIGRNNESSSQGVEVRERSLR
ncbi:unnamed protein product [Calypogeia fissa]